MGETQASTTRDHRTFGTGVGEVETATSGDAASLEMGGLSRSGQVQTSGPQPQASARHREDGLLPRRNGRNGFSIPTTGPYHFPPRSGVVRLESERGWQPESICRPWVMWRATLPKLW